MNGTVSIAVRPSHPRATTRDTVPALISNMPTWNASGKQSIDVEALTVNKMSPVRPGTPENVLG